MTTDTPRDFCPNCNKELNQVTNSTGNKRPSPGAFSICVGCGELLVFKSDLLVRKVTAQDLEELKKKDRVFYENLKIVQSSILRAIENVKNMYAHLLPKN